MGASVVTRDHMVRGLMWALVSAAAYGFSGPLGAAFLEAGWSPGLTTLLRIAGAAVLLLPVAVVMLRLWRDGTTFAWTKEEMPA